MLAIAKFTAFACLQATGMPKWLHWLFIPNANAKVSALPWFKMLSLGLRSRDMRGYAYGLAFTEKMLITSISRLASQNLGLVTHLSAVLVRMRANQSLEWASASWPRCAAWIFSAPSYQLAAALQLQR
ncbi:hypothetical protein LNV08_13755 [Paucibacter sp. TC2R-5]|nr:hypothetical protein [Paucibacter sp. TC2R-5]